MALILGIEAEPVVAGFAASMRRFCGGLPRDADFSRGRWTAMAALGLFEAAVSDEFMSCVAGCHELGRVGWPGPISETVLMARVLAGEESAALIDGTAVATVGDDLAVPWAPVADLLFLWTVSGQLAESPTVSCETVPSIAGDLWGRSRPLGGNPRLLSAPQQDCAVAELTRAAYVLGAATTLLGIAAEYAGDRRQFGRSIGEFQAISHPLADCATGLEASDRLLWIAASMVASGDSRSVACVTHATVSARRNALATSFTAHQTLGAIGVTVEGPIGRLAGRLVQAAAPRSFVADGRTDAVDGWADDLLATSGSEQSWWGLT